MCDNLHAAGIKVVLDGVFNHVGRGFWAFQDVLEKRWDSPYKDWFHISFDGNSNYNDGLWYEGWEGNYDLVKLNLHNEDVIAHLFSCIKGWIDEFDIDGLRLDVAYCLDHDFIRRLRAYCDTLKPDFFLVGEVLSPIAFFGAALILTGVMVATVELPRLRAHGQARMAGAPEHVS